MVYQRVEYSQVDVYEREGQKIYELKIWKGFNFNVFKRKKRCLVGYIIFISVFNVTRNWQEALAGFRSQQVIIIIIN